MQFVPSPFSSFGLTFSKVLLPSLVLASPSLRFYYEFFLVLSALLKGPPDQEHDHFLSRHLVSAENEDMFDKVKQEWRLPAFQFVVCFRGVCWFLSWQCLEVFRCEEGGLNTGGKLLCFPPRGHIWSPVVCQVQAKQSHQRNIIARNTSSRRSSHNYLRETQGWRWVATSNVYG